MMRDMRTLFQRLPEMVIITDAYGYIMDYNREPEGMSIKKGQQIKLLIPNALGEKEIECVLGERIFRKQVTTIKRKNNPIGYTILFEDISDAKRLFEQRKKVSSELSRLVDENIKTNETLKEYAMQVKELSNYEEQLQLARHIHDDAGHAITAIYTISQMCLSLEGKASGEYDELIKEGFAICKKAKAGEKQNGYTSMNEIVDTIKRECRFPIEATVEGVEPEFAAGLYETIDRIIREAYHNTIDHSMADRLFVRISMSQRELNLNVQDNGSFHGEFEKGFGLETMEDTVLKTGGEITFSARQGEGFGILVRWGENNE